MNARWTASQDLRRHRRGAEARRKPFKELIRQKNLWVSSGSGSLPSE
jgi:hypothetical protein